MLNRKTRRLKGVAVIEDKHNIRIADLHVMVSAGVPDGIMLVSPAEGDRLAKMVEDAQKRATRELAQKAQEEGK